MKITTWRSAADRCDNRATWCEWPEYQGFASSGSCCCGSHHLLMRITT